MTQGARTSARGYNVPIAAHWPTLDQTRSDLSCGVTCYYMITMLLHEYSNGDKWCWPPVSTGTCGWGLHGANWCTLACIKLGQIIWDEEWHVITWLPCYYMNTAMEISGAGHLWALGHVGGGYMVPTDVHWHVSNWVRSSEMRSDMLLHDYHVITWIQQWR